MTAEQRREAVLEAAVREFAEYGLHGGSVERIAAGAGISQPYVFRLFGTKRDLFLACCHRVCDRILEVWRAAEGSARRSGAEGEDLLGALGEAYVRLLDRRDELLMVLQGVAASRDPDVLAAMHERFEQLHAHVTRATGAPPAAVQAFFAQGMLLTVAAGMDLPALAGERRWAGAFLGPPFAPSGDDGVHGVHPWAHAPAGPPSASPGGGEDPSPRSAGPPAP